MSREVSSELSPAPAKASRLAARKTAPARSVAPGRPPVRGVPTAGRIAALSMGQRHGFIRLEDRRDVFFHRSDVRDGLSFDAFTVGDRVTFELIEDTISGPRAVQVGPRPPRR